MRSHCVLCDGRFWDGDRITPYVVQTSSPYAPRATDWTLYTHWYSCPVERYTYQTATSVAFESTEQQPVDVRRHFAEQANARQARTSSKTARHQDPLSDDRTTHIQDEGVRFPLQDSSIEDPVGPDRGHVWAIPREGWRGARSCPTSPTQTMCSLHVDFEEDDSPNEHTVEQEPSQVYAVPTEGREGAKSCPPSPTPIKSFFVDSDEDVDVDSDDVVDSPLQEW